MIRLSDLSPDLLFIIGQKVDAYTQPFLFLTCQIFYRVCKRTRKPKNIKCLLSNTERLHFGEANNLIEIADSYIIYDAIEVGNLDVIKELISKDCLLPTDTSLHAALSDRCDIMIYLHKIIGTMEIRTIGRYTHENMSFSYSPLNFAAAGDSPECSDYMIQNNIYEKTNGCIPNECYSVAAKLGGVKMVKHLIGKYDGKRRKFMISYAIQHGHIELVKYLHSEGFSINENSYSLAIVKGGKEGLEIVKYLCRNNCTMSFDNYAKARDNEETEIVNFLIEQGCPIQCPTAQEHYDWFMRNVGIESYTLRDAREVLRRCYPDDYKGD